MLWASPELASHYLKDWYVSEHLIVHSYFFKNNYIVSMNLMVSCIFHKDAAKLKRNKELLLTIEFIGL
jgi:hypothetical protein